MGWNHRLGQLDRWLSQWPRRLAGRHRRHSAWREIVVGGVGVFAASGAIWVATTPASASALPATVMVNAGQTLGTFPSTEVGANVTVLDNLLADARTSALMKDAGIKYLRYPGGPSADTYHWQAATENTQETGETQETAATTAESPGDAGADNAGEPGKPTAENTGFDAFMGMVRAAEASPILTANYDSGTAAEAASWVRYANITKEYGVRYWEIGNEVYGNGHYGSGGENDTHADKSPKAYADTFLEYASAMKAVDATIRVGLSLTTPGIWPDGVIGSGDTADWNDTVLSIVRDRADFATFHFYPGGSNERDMLEKPATLATAAAIFKTDLSRWGVGSIPIFVTEINGGTPRNTQAQALWAADMYMVAAEAGIANVDWWNVHNGAGSTTTDVTDATDHGDEGLISNGSGSEPTAQTPFKPYYGIQMISKIAAGGDALISVASNQSKLAVHAVRRAGGGIDLMLINKDPENAYTVSFSYTGFTPAPAITVDTFALGASAITSGTTGTAMSRTIPAYSIVALHLVPETGQTRRPQT